MDSRLSNVPDARGRRVTFCVALAAFTFQFEAFVVIVALPAIAAHFHLSAAGAALVPVLYLTAAAAVFIPAGRWGDRHGLQCGFIAGVTLLLAGIGCVCLAPNAAALLAGRVLQGLGGGCMVAQPRVPASLGQFSPWPKRPLLKSLMASTICCWLFMTNGP